MKSLHSQNQKGFVALFAVFLSIIVLAISVGIANVSYKEILLSSSAREANSAFFAADTGIECALYYDLNVKVFLNSATGATIDKCKGPAQSVSKVPGSGSDYSFSFDLDYDNSCARVTVNKNVQVGTNNMTQIESKGYNMSCGDVDQVNNTPGISSARLVERAIRASYIESTQAPPPPPPPPGPAS